MQSCVGGHVLPHGGRGVAGASRECGARPRWKHSHDRWAASVVPPACCSVTALFRTIGQARDQDCRASFVCVGGPSVGRAVFVYGKSVMFVIVFATFCSKVKNDVLPL